LYRHQTVDIIGGDTAAVNLEGIHVKAEALPQAKLLHVGVKMHVEHPVIGDALLEPTPVAERLAIIDAAQHHSVLGKSFTHATRVELECGIVRNAGVGHIAIGARPGRRSADRNDNGQKADGPQHESAPDRITPASASA
jgi:hypothetical protein